MSEPAIPDESDIPSFHTLLQDMDPAFGRGQPYTLVDYEVEVVYFSLLRLKALEEAGTARDWEMVKTLCPVEE